MMASRGMGKISSSKMPKQKTITRKDGDKVSLFKKGGKVKKFVMGEEVLLDPELLSAVGETGLTSSETAALAEQEASRVAAEEAAKQESMDKLMRGERTPAQMASEDLKSRLGPSNADAFGRQIPRGVNVADLGNDNYLRGTAGRGRIGAEYTMLTRKEGGKVGLYDNINAKRKRIAAGSNEKMRKPGSKGAPTKQAFINSAKTAK